MKSMKMYKIIAASLICILAITCLRVLNNTPITNEVLADNISNMPTKAYEEKIINADVKSEIVIGPTINEVCDEKVIDVNDKSNTKFNYTKHEIYELAKIVMCEAEGESQKCKEYVAQTVLNRVNDYRFPDNIHDVIFQNNPNQFTPTIDGRWEKVEPNQYCYDAVYTVLNASEPLTDATFFEACEGESWHSENLTFITQISNTRFYK